MRASRFGFIAAALLLVFASSAVAENKDSSALTIVYKDHHERTVTAAEVSRIDLRNQTLVLNHGGSEERIPLAEVASIEVHGASETAMTRSSYIGKWEVGMGGGAAGTFRITLDRDGQAHKTVGSHHGRWTFVNGEARIEWDDGWHDVIAKVEGHYEKRAYEPGKSYSEPTTNIAEARRANDQSI